MTLFTKLKYWFQFGKRVWISLAAGWLAVAIGFTPELRMDRAGALLTCAVIVASVFNDNRHRLFVDQVLPGFRTFHILKEVEMKDGDKVHQGIEITLHNWASGKTTVNADNWHLYHLANEKEFRVSEGGREWDLSMTMKRLESRVEYAIVSSAVVGTILWAFS